MDFQYLSFKLVTDKRNIKKIYRSIVTKNKRELGLTLRVSINSIRDFCGALLKILFYLWSKYYVTGEFSQFKYKIEEYIWNTRDCTIKKHKMRENH